MDSGYGHQAPGNQGDRVGYLMTDDREGPLLVFGGPYSNLQATRALRRAAGEMGIAPGNCICTGDVVAYCADAAATVTEIRDWGCHVIAGNCEKQLAEGAADCGCGFEAGSACDLLSVGWYAHADRQIGAGDRAWMAALPNVLGFTHEGRQVRVCHGGFTDVSRFLWPASPDRAFQAELEALADDRAGPGGGRDAPAFVFSGHSGIAFERRIDDVRWVNAGAIGMPPNDGAPGTRFVVLDGDRVTVHRLGYDWRGAQAAMVAAGLVQGYDAALGSGWWPSEDVLPVEMRRAGGHAR